jgi:cathepsin B
MTKEQKMALMGARKRSENPRKHLFKVEPKLKGGSTNDIPKNFDSRDQWPVCKDVIGTIADQSSCGSCWAVSSASVMSDRVCISTSGKNKQPISAIDLTSCCSSCGNGCQGGWPDEAFYFWDHSGVVTGSGYTLDTGCSPYPFKECEHHTNRTKYSPCPKSIYKTPRCTAKCQTSYKANTYKNDKVFGKQSIYISNDIESIQREIMSNGPVVFTFDVYADFETYSSGIYKHTTGSYLGGHAVRAIGWGEENGTPYWLIANSWNEDWGENGYFRMVRGIDNCGIENEVSAAQFKQ